MTSHFYEPRNGHRLPHSPLNAIVAPRPIGWISTISADGGVNLAPYSHFNIFNDEPPILIFSAGREKDSVRNVRQTGEFVWNLATFELAAQMNVSSVDFPYGVSEMEYASLEPAPSTLVRPPRVARSPAAFECKVIDIRNMSDRDGARLPAILVTGQVVGIHIRPEFLKDGLFDTAAAQPLARCGYLGDYVHVSSLIQMLRPASVPDRKLPAQQATA
jgi:flavin reductase (DIM6/NTAB) family NADH-FMN oxidoreductase RutF